ncbi:MAG: hypothetical protein CMJ18_01745 [Phycisphaeraceae bacterium]|nr:hypothetical protein [Phycisphaeraceae bacterium]
MCCALIAAISPIATAEVVTRLVGNGPPPNGDFFYYSFTSSEDGFTWQNVSNGGNFTTPDGVRFINQTGNLIQFDDTFVGAGDATVPFEDALWVNPQNFGGFDPTELIIELPTETTEVDFGVAWANSDPNTPAFLDFMDVIVEDSEGNAIFESPFLDTFNAFSGTTGYEGYFTYSIDPEFPDELVDISRITIDLAPVAQGTQFGRGSVNSGTGLFIMDDLNFVSSGGGVLPGESEIVPGDNDPPGSVLVGVGTNYLTTASPSTRTLGMSVTNVGGDPTTFSLIERAGSDFTHPANTNIPINGGETVDVNPVIQFSTAGRLSGAYQGSVDVVDDLNASDPTEVVDFGIELYDPPILSDNSGSTIDPTVNGIIEISNAAAGPHQGALRASVFVEGTELVGQGFSVDGIAIDTDIFAGDTVTGAVGFDAVGLAPGTYTGTFTAHLRMSNDRGHLGFLVGRQDVDSVIWNLSVTVIPEPASMLALLTGTTMILAGRRTSRR